jgi:hypothetical protein
MKRMFFWAFLGASLVLSAPGQATVITQVYTGTVSSGYDYEGVFGSPGTALDEAAFTATFVFDTAAGFLDTQSTYEQLYGGLVYVSSSALVSGTLQIGASSVPIPGGYAEYTQTISGPPGNINQYASHADDGGPSYLELYVRSYLTTFPGSLTAGLPFTYLVTADTSDNDGGYGFFQLLDSSGNYRAFVSLLPAGVTVTVGSEVPLPAALPLFAGGLGMIGLLARRRRQARTA